MRNPTYPTGCFVGFWCGESDWSWSWDGFASTVILKVAIQEKARKQTRRAPNDVLHNRDTRLRTSQPRRWISANQGKHSKLTLLEVNALRAWCWVQKLVTSSLFTFFDFRVSTFNKVLDQHTTKPRRARSSWKQTWWAEYFVKGDARNLSFTSLETKSGC